METAILFFDSFAVDTDKISRNLSTRNGHRNKMIKNLEIMCTTGFYENKWKLIFTRTHWKDVPAKLVSKKIT